MRKATLIFSLIIFALIGCQNNKSEVPIEKSLVSSSSHHSTDVYKDILSDYINIVDFRLSANFEKNWNSGNFIEISQSLSEAKTANADSFILSGVALDEKWSYMITDMVNGIKNPTKASFGYILKDINNDGNPELFWVRSDHTILAFFTIRDDSPVLLDAFYNRYTCVITNDWKLYNQSTGGAAYTNFSICELSSDATYNCTITFGTDGFSDEAGTVYYKVENNERLSITISQFEKMLEAHPFENSQKWLETPITYI